MDNISEIVEPEVTTETVVEEVTAEEAVSTEEVIDTPVSENEAEVAEEVEVESVETEVIPEESEDETEFACGNKKTQCAKCGEDKTKCACGDKKAKNEKSDDEPYEDEEDKKECPECGENPCICKNGCNGKDKKYSLLEQEYAELKAKYESLTNEHNAALEALKKYSRNEKLEIISKFSTKLEDSEELIANLTENVDNLTEEEIKAELGTALVDQITAEEEEAPVEESNNFSLNLNLNPEVRNDAWSLVDAYKNRK